MIKFKTSARPMEITPQPVAIHTEEEDRTAALLSCDILDTPPEADFDEFVRLAASLVGTPFALLCFADADRLWSKAHVEWPETVTAREGSFVSQAMEASDVFVVDDAGQDERFVDNPWVRRDPPIRFFAGAPLTDADGHVLGALCVMDTVEREFSFEHKDALLTLSRLVVAQLALRRRLTTFKRSDRARRDALGALKHAVRGGEFVVHYQPKVSLLSGATTGLEALIRWDRPGHGLISPNDFIPLLEESGLILEVGAWVLGQSADHHRDWMKKGLNAPRIAANVSPAQFRDRNFLRELQRVAGAGEDGVDIEISEAVLTGNPDKAIATLRTIRELGIGVAIDNFGTGASSWRYLTRLPVDAIKIDRSFISAMSSEAGADVVACMISLAHSLDIRVVAEGVETDAQRERLRAFGCDEIQGYLISHPLTKRETENFLNADGDIEPEDPASPDPFT
jgi:EAL domain-containing protein (putative c-di-GMP-specific phosphodiesterase class I)